MNTDNANWPFRGVCVGVPGPDDHGIFGRMVEEILPDVGCNNLVLLIRYRYEFTSHPEVRDRPALSGDRARELAGLCAERGIRLIPKMNLFGHQSHGEKMLGLLRAHPELDETPEREVDYCHSLCPRHPRTREIVPELIDELIDVFEPEFFHVGLDEVFQIGECERCQGTPNGELFAEWVGFLHDQITTRRGVRMMMWGDRLLDGEKTGYGRWEASDNGTAPAVDRIPRDILICDWHYGRRDAYPSIPHFLERGFQVVCCPWKDSGATRALLDYARGMESERLLGVLATTWCDAGAFARYLVQGEEGEEETPALAAESFRLAMGTG